MEQPLCCLSQVAQSASLQRDSVDGSVQLLVLSVEIPCRGGQALVVHQHPNRLQVLSVRQEGRGERMAKSVRADSGPGQPRSAGTAADRYTAAASDCTPLLDYGGRVRV